MQEGSGNLFERGASDVFELHAPQLGPLTKIRCPCVVCSTTSRLHRPSCNHPCGPSRLAAGCDTMHRALCPIGRWTLSLLWTTHCSYAFSSTASRSSPRRRRLSSCLAPLAMHLLDWEAHRSQLQALLSIRAVLPASRCRYRDLRNLAKKTESMTVLENLPVPPKKRRAFLLASKKRSFMRTGN